MTLTGTYTRNLDEKHRLAVPKQLREQFGERELSSLYIAPETERSLALYSTAAFDQLAARFAEGNSHGRDVRNYLRLFYSRAAQVELDKQGRIRIPERLVDFAQLKRDVVLIGVHDHAEIWDHDLWTEFLGKHGSEFDEMASTAFT